MMSVLGPLSIDPNMLNTQKQQVQVRGVRLQAETQGCRSHADRWVGVMQALRTEHIINIKVIS